jgi:hypothetical protein
MCATEETAANFRAVADHTAFAMFANRGDCLNSAFKAVKRMSSSGSD